MLSCLGFRKARRHSHGEREPLLPQYGDDTARQARLHEKIHSYQMLRAMSQGYMPSNLQAIVHLRALLSADLLNPDTAGLSTAGRALVSSARLWLVQFIDLLEHKNPHDQVQDFIWHLARVRHDIDPQHVGARAAASKGPRRRVRHGREPQDGRLPAAHKRRLPPVPRRPDHGCAARLSRHGPRPRPRLARGGRPA